MSPIRKRVYSVISTSIVIWALAGLSAGQNIIASVAIPTAAAGQVAVNTALNKVYAGGGPNTGGTSLTIIDGFTFAVVTSKNPSAGVSADMKNDNIWTGNLTAGDVAVYSGDNYTEISSTTVGSCPAAVTFDCRGRMWVASQCGTGNDPLWVFNTGNLKMLEGPITPGGTIAQPPVADPDTETLYVTSGGVSKEINPKTFAVSNTKFGTVMAVDSNSNKLFATSGKNLQIILGHTEAISTTVALTYTPAAMGVNSALAHVYLANTAGNSIDVYSEAGKKLTTFLLGTNNQPNQLAVDSTRGRLYVDVFDTGTNSWALDVIEDLSSVRKCGFAGSCDY
jgi:DNA-binding beta-propeller fold protein YncE